ncbi:MAG: hypothetical protein IPO91_00565 [Chloroflexi bacterium]|nr:hypothetical protein [Chloroflexota bacterium]
MVDNHTDSFLIPGTTAHAHLTYDRNGRLTSLTCGVDQQRTYVEQVGSKRVFAGGWVTQSEIVAGQRLLRQVAAGDDFWVETYEWDQAGRLILVDGVRVDRDERGRVSACVTEFGSWHYGYKGDHIAEIAFAPVPDQVAFARRVGRGADGRALRLKQDGRVTRFRSISAAGAQMYRRSRRTTTAMPGGACGRSPTKLVRPSSPICGITIAVWRASTVRPAIR